jgi:hypothetical protein
LNDTPCPHCGRGNEPEREVCWACFELLTPSAKAEEPPAPAAPAGAASTTKIVVNGVEYARLEDVPEPLRSKIRADVASAGQGLASGKRSRIVVNGVDYERVEDVPEPLRSRLLEGLSRAKTDVVKITKSVKRE